MKNQSHFTKREFKTCCLQLTEKEIKDYYSMSDILSMELKRMIKIYK